MSEKNPAPPKESRQIPPHSDGEVSNPAPPAERCAKCGHDVERHEEAPTANQPYCWDCPPPECYHIAPAPLADGGYGRTDVSPDPTSVRPSRTALCECGELPGHPRHDKDTGDHAFVAPAPRRVVLYACQFCRVLEPEEHKSGCEIITIAALRARVAELERVVEEAFVRGASWAYGELTGAIIVPASFEQKAVEEAKVNG